MKWNQIWAISMVALAFQACSDELIYHVPASVDDNFVCECTSHQACCNDVCIDIYSDRDNCGSCGHACKKDQICDNKVCKDDETGPACTPKTCDELGAECGSVSDGCSHTLECGTCSDNLLCSDGHCIDPADCVPKTCKDQGVECGSAPDGCTNTLECGTCTEGLVCSEGHCISAADCTAKSCIDLGISCGSAEDGCGKTLDCGSCNEDKICSEGKCVDKPTNCTPKTCEDLGRLCGSVDDGCGQLLDCGYCLDDKICSEGRCVDKPVECTPKTCSDLKKSCGSADDGCGNPLDCGSCGANQTCKDGACVNNCAPKTCADLKLSCGNADDGCGKSLDCGTCAANQTCQSGKCVNNCTPTTCSAKGKNCGSISDGCGGTLNCGSCSSSQTCKDNVCTNQSIKDTYPTRKSIKGLQPDFQDMNQIVGNDVHGVAMNMVWAIWQPSQTGSCGAGQVLYDGNCFSIDGNTANTIKAYSDKGVLVTAIIYGVPGWARISNCSSQKRINDWFCAPASGREKDYGRFAGFLAHYFNGESGHGRIADFVIHNEVNNYQWFNAGYSDMSHMDNQVNYYAASFNAAYDYVRKEQAQAKVLISLDHFFGQQSSANGSYASRDFLLKLIPKLGDRQWMLAYHSYPPNLADPAFGPDDWANLSQRITFGTLGILAAWLRQTYPDKPYSWEFQLTENGLNGSTSAMQARQQSQLCQAFQNVLGTPGISNFIYHRLIDVKEEGLNLGLWNSDGSQKPAWTTFALANRSGVGAGWPACGFQYLPYVEMMRGRKGNMHWVTTRQFPSGFTKEAGQSWKILRDKPSEDSVMVYECRVGGAGGGHTMISPDVNCEGQFNMGPMGYLYKSQKPGTSAVYRCYVPSTGSHFISADPNCEGQTTESAVGYAIKL